MARKVVSWQWAPCLVLLLAELQLVLCTFNYSTERFSRPLQKLVYVGDSLYVAGQDSLYKLDSTFAILQTRELSVAPGEATAGSVTCLGEYNRTHLFICSSHRGVCEIITAGTLMIISTTPAKTVTTNSTHGTVVFVNAPFEDVSRGERAAVWISTSYSVSLGLPAVALSVRDPETLETSYTYASQLDESGHTTELRYTSNRAAEPGTRMFDEIVYVYAFSSPDGYRMYIKNNHGKAFLGGLCKDDDRFNTLTEVPLACSGGTTRKFVQAAYVASAGTLLYHHIQLTQSDLTPSDQFLYAAFGNSATSSDTSLCVFSVRALVAKLKQVFFMCHISGNRVDVSVGPPELLQVSNPSECSVLEVDNSTDITPCQLVKMPAWTREDGYTPILYKIDVQRSSRIDMPFAVNALMIHTVGPFTVAFMASPAGIVYKAVIGIENRWGVYKAEDLTGQMTSTTTLLNSISVGDGRIYTITRDRVFSVPVEQCHLATDCLSCTNLRDPYCGWCSLSHRCTTRSNCSRYEETGHWVQDSGDSTSPQCIVASIDETNISVDGGENSISLSVKVNQVPVILSTESYKCCFFGEVAGSEVCTDATKQTTTSGLNRVEQHVLQCGTPDQSVIRLRIRNLEQDRIDTNLILKIDDDEFARLNLTFFQCSAHVSCTTCARASILFSCGWCFATRSCFQDPNPDICTSGNIVVNSAVMIANRQQLLGADNCPRIEPSFSYTAPPPLIYVPSDTLPVLKFLFYNKQDDVSRYECKLSWDDRVATYEVVVDGSSSPHNLRCLIPPNGAISYSGSESTKRATIGIKLADTDNEYLDNPSNIQIEMYKCDKMKKTCGGCLSFFEARYGCGWCRDVTSICQVKEHCPMDREFLESNKNSCPDLEIAKIEPRNGTLHGSTRITISGENLGQSYSAIRDGVYIQLKGQSSVNRGRVNCTVIETLPYNPSEIVCLTMNTTMEGEGPVRVDIANSSLTASSTSDFLFRTPKPIDLAPKVGPLSGGSDITILGDYVNIGAERLVSIQALNGTRFPAEIVSDGINSHELIFVTPSVTNLQKVNIVLKIDGFEVTSAIFPIDPDFFYTNDSTVTRINPNKAVLSGGTFVNVFGTSLNIIQKPLMYFEWTKSALLPGESRSKRAMQDRTLASSPQTRITAPCSNTTETKMVCTLPRIPEHWLTTTNVSNRINYGFILDGIQSARDLAGKDGFSYFEIIDDPEFFDFGEKVISMDSPLEIKGENLLGIGAEDIVMLMLSVEFNVLEGQREKEGALSCVVTTVTDSLLYCDIPELDSAGKYAVNVNYGTLLRKRVGVVSLTRALSAVPSIPVIIGIAAGVGVVLIVVVVIICVLRSRLSKTDQGMKKLQDKMDNLEMTVAKECKEAFTELQTDMTEMTADIAALHGLPFYDYSQYCMKVLFPMQSEYDHPVINKLNIAANQDMVERGLRKFSSLIYKKTFLLTFIRTLEQQRKFTMRDRVEVASLVSVALQPCMEYHTDILKTLLAELIERTMETKKDPKILLRRNESVAEKMLSNWFAFLLQKFLKECAGEPLYLLYRAIKQQVDKGPVDAVTSDAKYSLSEDKLLRQIVESHPMTLRFCSPDPHAAQDPQTVKVLNCDTISQAVDKILDTLYRNVPNSTKPSRDTLTLEWLKPNGDRVAMFDDDPAFSKVESDGCKRIVTLQCYKITDNAMVALTPKQHSMDTATKSAGGQLKYDTSSSNGNYYGSTGDSLSRANSSNNILDMSKDRQRVLRYHMTKPSEAESHHEGDRNKMVSEIYLTRLLATKGTLQQFVDDLFETIFSISHRGSALPLAIKYMFDFLDDQALLHNIGSPEVIHHWKSNSLPLRFWVNVMKNPDFVFDIHKSNIVDACLSVVAQIFMDSCSLSEHRLGKESPSSKLLYAKDIPKYRKWVERYYSDIKSMPAISDHDMNAALAEESRQHRNEFNNSAALYELYQYVLQYQPELMGALREDEFARKDHLAEELASVNQLLNAGPRMC